MRRRTYHIDLAAPGATATLDEAIARAKQVYLPSERVIITAPNGIRAVVLPKRLDMPYWFGPGWEPLDDRETLHMSPDQ